MTAERDSVGVPANSGLGGRIRAARTGRGLSREAVAALCGRSEEWLRQIERGRRGTSLHMLAKLADVLRVKDFAELLGDHAPTAVFARPEHPALGEFRKAIVAFGPTAAETAPTAAALQARVRYAWQRRSASHRDRTDLAAVLPELMVDSQLAARAAASPAQRRDLSRLLAQGYPRRPL
jgi:transcriptional regulator with XRE-family HTH domain